jgi:mono/diheme cytochrome c family protein
MRRIVPSTILALTATASLGALLSAQAPAAAPPTVSFTADIQPILEKNCMSCHGEAMQMGKFDLRSRESTLAGGAHGSVVVAGNGEQSKLYRMVAGLEKPQMPMTGGALSGDEVAKIKAWIDQGVQWDAAVSFTKDVQPIFASSCFTCHGDSAQLSKFDLRTRETALSGGDRGSDIVPGNSEQSRLYRRVAGLEKPSMPMQGTPLNAAQVATLKKWIEEGAKWDVVATSTSTSTSTSSASSAAAPASGSSVSAAVAALMERPITPEERNYWAFKLPVQAPPPVVANKDLINPIDRFLEKTRVDQGLKAAPRADRNTIVRRAYLDLLGLPPTPAEVAEFMADQSPDAWEHLIDKLLASPHYGERYGRAWLDVAR